MAPDADLKIVALMWATGLFLTIGSPISALACNESREGAPPSYESGHGLPLGETCATIGGYASAQYQAAQNGAPRASLSHLSLFVWWEGGSRLKFFSEFDNQSRYDYQFEPGSGRYMSIERVYLDYIVSDSLTLRAGKYLTPIGRWNQLHADPLVWTTSRPLITRNLFPDNASGLMAMGNFQILGRQADYALYAALGSEARLDPAQDSFHETRGVRLNVPIDQNLQFGWSYASFDQGTLREERQRLLGLDFLWSVHGHELSGEAMYRKSGAGWRRAAKGGFIQGVMPLYDRLFAIGRIETLRDLDLPDTHGRAVLGLNYRNRHAMSFKLEWIHGTRHDVSAPVGWLSSVSVLF